MLFKMLQSLFLPESECINLLKIHVLDRGRTESFSPLKVSGSQSVIPEPPSSSIQEHFRNAGPNLLIQKLGGRGQQSIAMTLLTQQKELRLG